MLIRSSIDILQMMMKKYFLIYYLVQKKQLEVDCQKEIAEAAAKIRQKFVVKIQESEAEYVSKKKELETNLNKVMMNKVLAAAFRYKCMDVKKSGTPGTVRSGI